MRAALHRFAAPAATLSAGLAADCFGSHRHRGSARAEQRHEQAKRVAFLGNSYLYFNDVPRVFQFLSKQDGEDVHIRDCLRGGSSFRTLMKNGNGMAEKFRTPAALQPDGTYDVGAPTVEALLGEPRGWDFVVLNTFSQEAAIPARKREGLSAIGEMAPMIDRARACPVLLVTPAYREHAKGSERIGSWEEFTWKQSEGYRQYAEKLMEVCPAGLQPRIADVNVAFQIVHGEQPEMWRELFYKDDFHPSALGSFLEACVVYCAIFGRAPPLPEEVLQDPSKMWARARRMLPPPEVGRLPTREEMLYLRDVAVRAWSSDELARLERR